MNIFPTIISHTPKGQFIGDVYSRLLAERTILLNEPIDDVSVGSAVAQLLCLQQDDPQIDIKLWICSSGGVVDSALFLVDTIKLINPDVITVCGGKCFSAASVIFSSGTKGKRYIMENASLMVHTVSASTGRQKIADMEISTERSRELNDRLFGILSRNSGRSAEEIEEYAQHDLFLNAEQAVEFGLADKILKSKK